MRKPMHQFQHRINGIRRLHRGEQSVLIVITGIYAGADYKGYHFRALQAGAGLRQGERGTAAERFITAMERTAMDKPRPRPAVKEQAKVQETAQAPAGPEPSQAITQVLQDATQAPEAQETMTAAKA